MTYVLGTRRYTIGSASKTDAEHIIDINFDYFHFGSEARLIFHIRLNLLIIGTLCILFLFFLSPLIRVFK